MNPSPLSLTFGQNFARIIQRAMAARLMKKMGAAGRAVGDPPRRVRAEDVNRLTTGKTYPMNGAREVARRQRQIARGQLHTN